MVKKIREKGQTSKCQGCGTPGAKSLMRICSDAWLDWSDAFSTENMQACCMTKLTEVCGRERRSGNLVYIGFIKQIWTIRTADDSVWKSPTAVAFPVILWLGQWAGCRWNELFWQLTTSVFLLDLSSYCCHPMHLPHEMKGLLICRNMLGVNVIPTRDDRVQGLFSILLVKAAWLVCYSFSSLTQLLGI